MGFKKPLISDIKMELLKSHGEIMSPYNDGYTQWALKQEMYEIKFLLEEMIKRQPKFNGEEEWLVEQEKKHMWSQLKT